MTADVSAFRFDPASGVLTLVGTFPTGGSSPFAIAVVPDRYVVVTDLDDDTLTIFSYDDSGQLHQAGPSIATGDRPLRVAVVVP